MHRRLSSRRSSCFQPLVAAAPFLNDSKICDNGGGDNAYCNRRSQRALQICDIFLAIPLRSIPYPLSRQRHYLDKIVGAARRRLVLADHRRDCGERDCRRRTRISGQPCWTSHTYPGGPVLLPIDAVGGASDGVAQRRPGRGGPHRSGAHGAWYLDRHRLSVRRGNLPRRV